MRNVQHGRRRWLILTTIGLAVGLPGGLALGAPLEVLVGAMIVTPLMLGLSGLLLGGSQWVALRDRLPGSTRWIGLSALGFAVGFTAAVVLVEQGGAWLTGEPTRMATTGPLGLAVSLVVIGLIGGGTLGLAQSLAVRGVDGAVRAWTATSAVGLTVAFLFGMGVAALTGGMASGAGLSLFLLTSGLVYAALTGRAIERIVATPRSP